MYLNTHKDRGESTYQLANNVGDRGGWVKFDWDKDVQAVKPHYENTIVVLKNGTHYLLFGRGYGV